MWQRIQTLYLLLSAALVAVLFGSNAMTVNSADGLETVRYIELSKPYFLILMIIWALGTLLALFSFKVRILQMRLAVVCALVALGVQAWLAYLYFTAPEGVVFRYTAIFPLLVCILDFLAARSAFQDQLVVESAYRVRESRRRRRK